MLTRWPSRRLLPPLKLKDWLMKPLQSKQSALNTIKPQLSSNLLSADFPVLKPMLISFNLNRALLKPRSTRLRLKSPRKFPSKMLPRRPLRRRLQPKQLLKQLLPKRQLPKWPTTLRRQLLSQPLKLTDMLTLLKKLPPRLTDMVTLLKKLPPRPVTLKKVLRVS